MVSKLKLSVINGLNGDFTSGHSILVANALSPFISPIVNAEEN